MAEPGRDPAHDPAIGRYYLLQLMRFGCVGIVLLGGMVMTGQIDAPDWLGGLALGAGAVGFFTLPNRLARRWRSDTSQGPVE
ncbi:MAG: hypothetical protein MK010_11165 [Erythrobacter sp.]|nr:hypothetical protein [Erythrobacter sp.]